MVELMEKKKVIELAKFYVKECACMHLSKGVK